MMEKAFDWNQKVRVYVTSYVTLGKPLTALNHDFPLLFLNGVIVSYRGVVRISENMSIKSDWKLNPMQMQDNVVGG